MSTYESLIYGVFYTNMAALAGVASVALYKGGRHVYQKCQKTKQFIVECKESYDRTNELVEQFNCQGIGSQLHHLNNQVNDARYLIQDLTHIETLRTKYSIFRDAVAAAYTLCDKYDLINKLKKHLQPEPCNYYKDLNYQINNPVYEYEPPVYNTVPNVIPGYNAPPNLLPGLNRERSVKPFVCSRFRNEKTHKDNCPLYKNQQPKPFESVLNKLNDTYKTYEPIVKQFLPIVTEKAVDYLMKQSQPEVQNLGPIIKELLRNDNPLTHLFVNNHSQPKPLDKVVESVPIESETTELNQLLVNKPKIEETEPLVGESDETDSSDTEPKFDKPILQVNEPLVNEPLVNELKQQKPEQLENLFGQIIQQFKPEQFMSAFTMADQMMKQLKPEQLENMFKIGGNQTVNKHPGVTITSEADEVD